MKNNKCHTQLTKVWLHDLEIVNFDKNIYILVKKGNVTPLSIVIAFLIQTIFYDTLLFSSLYVVMNIDMCTQFFSVQL